MSQPSGSPMLRAIRGMLPPLLALALLAPRSSGAQANTAEMLERAVAMYQDLQVERALVLLRQVVSPTSPFVVSREQRVEAYKYLGGSLAILGQRDSALVFFRAALERDPFVDLDPAIFTPTERAIFAEARQNAFAVGLRPVTVERIDPAREAFTFGVVTTHRAAVRVSVRSARDSAVAVLLAAELENFNEVRWNGVARNGRIAPAGRYALVVTAASKLGGRTDSVIAYFDIQHEHEPLEDTLPSLMPAELLPERYGRSASAGDVLRGLGLASATLLIGQTVGNSALGQGRKSLGYAVAGTAATAGIAASIRRQRRPEIGENVVENERRRQMRARANAEIASRNAARLSVMRLVITPTAGIGQ